MLTETNRRGEFLLSEGPGSISREADTITGGDYESGTVLGRLTADGRYTQLTPGATDGSEVAAAVLFDKASAAVTDDNQVIIVRLAELKDDRLIWPDTVDQAQKDTAIGQLAANFLIVR